MPTAFVENRELSCGSAPHQDATRLLDVHPESTVIQGNVSSKDSKTGKSYFTMHLHVAPDLQSAASKAAYEHFATLEIQPSSGL